MLKSFSGYYDEICCGSSPTNWIKDNAIDEDDAFLQTYHHLINDYMRNSPHLYIDIKNSNISWNAEYMVQVDKLYRIISPLQFRTKCKLTSNAWRKNPKTDLLKKCLADYYFVLWSIGHENLHF